MADTAKRLFGPILATNAEVTWYTVPANTTTIVRDIRVVNTSGTAATFTMSIGADAAGTRLFPALSIAANSIHTWVGFLVLNAAETVRGQAGTTNVLTVTVSGVEVT